MSQGWTLNGIIALGFLLTLGFSFRSFPFLDQPHDILHIEEV
jgi:hypothetical protein